MGLVCEEGGFWRDDIITAIIDLFSIKDQDIRYYGIWTLFNIFAEE